MNPVATQQVALDNSLITAEVPKIYMHQFWTTIKKIRNSDAYNFKLEKKKFLVDTEVFREILQICPRILNQDFIAPPSEEELVTFIQELGYSGKCASLGKQQDLIDSGNHDLKSCGDMYNKKNVDYVALIWEDFMYQADNREISSAQKEYMPYPRFTKFIISHFISKDKTISIRNRINLHTIHADSLLGNGYSLKDKNEAKTDKTEHENGKSVKSQSQSQKVNKSKTKPTLKKS
ncbi:hypothetical protein Tco_1379290 [Tanacetum coccineum]